MADLAQLGIAIDTSGVRAGVSSLKDLTAAGSTAETRLKSIGTTFSKTGESLNGKLSALSTQFNKLGLQMSAGITVPLGYMATQAIGAAREFETAFTGVQKTVNGSELEIANLRTGILAMSKVLPASATEIAKVAEAGGQLGVKTQDLLTFTRTMVDLGEATSLSAEESAIAISRMANIMGTSQSDFDKFGSAIVGLGNNLAANETEIVNMATRMATFGKQAGLSESQVLSFSGALVSVGIQAEAGGTAFGSVLTKMKDAVLAGGDDLQEFAKVAGVSAQEFANQFTMAPAEAVLSFISGLGNIQKSGESMTETLKTLSLSNERVKLTLGAISGDAEKVATALQIGKDAWAENNALTQEAEKRYATTDSIMAKLQNTITSVKVALGDALLPAIKELATAFIPVIEGIGKFVEWFNTLDSSVKNTVLIFVGTFAVGGPLLLAFGAFMAIITTISAPLLIGGAIVGGIIAGTLAIIANWEALKDKTQAIWSGIMEGLRANIDANLVNIVDAWASLKMKVVSLVSSLVTEIKTWLVDKFDTLIVAPIRQKVEAITGFFATMYDKVVGNSYVPDMVEIIGQEFSTLDGKMVSPTQQATDAVNASFRDMLDTTQGAINQMLTGVLRGTQSMKDAFKNLGQNLVLAFTNQAINQGIDSMFARVTQGAQVAANVRGASQGGGVGTAFAAGTGTTGTPSALAVGGTALGGAAAGVGFGYLGKRAFGSFGNNGQVQDFAQKGALAGGLVGGIVGSLVPGLGTALGAVAGTVLGGVLGATIGGVVNKESRTQSIFGGPIGAFLAKGPKKPEITASTTLGAQGNSVEGAFGFVATRGSRGGAAGETVLRDSLLKIDNALADHLTNAQVDIVKEILVNKKTFNEKSRKVGDAVSEVVQERLRLEVEAIGKSFGVSGNLGKTLITGDKFNEEQLQGVFEAIKFIKNFDDANKQLSRGLTDLTTTARSTAQQLVGETLSSIVAFKEETKRLGLPVEKAAASTKSLVEIMLGLKDAATPLSDVQQALANIHATFAELGPLLREVGISSEQAAAGLTRSLAKIRDDFGKEIQRQITSFKSPVTNTINDLIAVQGQRINDGTAVGAKLHPVWLLMLEEFKAIAKDLDPSQAGEARASIVAGLQSLGRFNESYINQAVTAFDSSLTKVADTADKAVDELIGLKDSLREFRSSLTQGEFSTLSPEQKFFEAQQTFTSTAALALSGNVDALKRLQDVSNTFLSANKDYNATSNPAALARVLAVLDQVTGGALSPQQQLNTTAQNIDLLQSQLTHEQRSFDAQVDSLDSFGRLLAEQTEVLKEISATAKDEVKAIDVQTSALVELLQASLSSSQAYTRTVQQQAGLR